VNDRLTFTLRGRRHPVPSFRRPHPPLVEAIPKPAVPPGRADWAWRGLLGFTTVLFLRPQDQFAPVEALHLAELFAVIGIVAMVLSRVTRGLTAIRITPEVLGVFAFGAAMLLSIPTSYWPGGSLHVFLDIYIKVLLIFVLLAHSLDRPERLDRLTFLIVLYSGYIALRAVIDGVRGTRLIEGDRVAGAVSGIFGNPNDLAMNMVVFLPFALVWAFRAKAPAVKRGAAAVCAGLMLAAIVFTRSRGGTLGLVVMMMTLTLGSIRLKPSIAAATIAALLLAVPLVPKSYWERMSSITDASKDPTGSRQARIDLLEEAWTVFLDHPVIGIGLGQFVNYEPDKRRAAWSRARVTHNAPLQVATELGIVGFVPFCYLIVSGARAAVEARRRATGGATRRGSRARFGLGHRHTIAPAYEDERLVAGATAVGPSLVGWFVCAFFASVALSWTLYYVLAIAAATRDVARAADAQLERVAA
jgi:O-antigen ligase